MIVDVKVPEVGESITEGVLAAWSVEQGQVVAADDPLFELETDKITLTVQAQEAGQISLLVEEGAEVTVGQVVAQIDTEAAGEESAEAADAAQATEDKQEDRTETPRERGKASPRPDDLSPAVRRLVQQHGLDPHQIEASGAGGRITKGDVLQHLQGKQDRAPHRADEAGKASQAAKAAKADSADEASSAGHVRLPQRAQRAADERTTRRPMSKLRQRIAQRLLDSQQQTASLTTFNEVDMTRVMALRKQHREAFEARYEVRLGFMSFFVKAAVDALKREPALNSQIDGNDMVEHHVYDIGVAVGTEQGLVVPVIRDADQLSFAQVEQTIGDFAARARARKLELHELQGGTFTISNGGVYGSVLSTPILNPPQSGILGLHGIKKRPVVVEDDRIEVRPMMNLALTYDHRLVDGKGAVTFLRRIVECIENPERMMLEI